MAKDFRLPDLGEGVHEGQIIRLLVAEGDPVREDQPLMEVETDKAAVEIPSPVSGTIAKWHVKEQQIVNVGDVMVTFGQTADAMRDGDTQTTPVQPTASTPAAQRVASPQRAQRATHSRKPASPAVRKRARQLGLDLQLIDGSGPAGRVSMADVERAAQSQSTPANDREVTVVIPQSREVPSLPRLAVPQQALSPAQWPATDESDQYGPIRRVPITQARKTVATVMSQSNATIPHVTDSDDADVTDLENLRRGYNSQELGADQPKLTMLAFVVRAVARALRSFPEFNASFDAENNQIIYRHYINVAVGVHTERGLVAPVIRNADQLDVPGIALALAEIVHKARNASFAVNDTRGGTYTISNAGAFGGSRYSTPIITPPQVAVLAVGRSRMMPWIVDGAIVPRLIMPLSHSIDHRLLDGGQEIAFMKHVIQDLEQPGRLVWERHGRR